MILRQQFNLAHTGFVHEKTADLESFLLHWTRSGLLMRTAKTVGGLLTGLGQ